MRVLTENGSIGKLDGPGWSPQTALKAKCLLMEFHHMFSLELNEMGCIDTAEHTIELLTGEDEPFKERFRRIAPHEVEEVRQHIQEMLDGGAIHPSQLPWCNAVVLVWKKDRTLRFCIDFRRLNAKTKKDSHPLPRGPRNDGIFGGRPIFLHGGLEEWFLANQDGRRVAPVYGVHSQQSWDLRVSQDTFRAV